MDTLIEAKRAYERLYVRLTGRTAAQFERHEWPRLAQLWAVVGHIPPSKQTAIQLGWLRETRASDD